MATQSNNLQQVNFLNGVYYGNLRAEKCHGRGVFLWDSGEFYFGEWEQNKMHGEGIFFFAYGGVLKGQFYRSKINGAAILKFPNGDVYEGFWRHGKLDGKCFKYFQKDKTWALCIYENGIYKKYLNRGKGTPNMNFEEKLTDGIEISFLGDQEKYIGMLPFTDGGKYYGVIENDTANGLGLTSHINGKNDIGLYLEGIITGLGRLSFSEGSFYDGELKEGQLEGEGFFYKKDSNKWVFGKFEDGKCTSVEKKGSGIPLEEISKQKFDLSGLTSLEKWKANRRGYDMPTFKHVLNNVFAVPLLEITKKKLPTQRFIGLKKTPVRNLSPMKDNSQIITDINKVLEDVPFNQQPQSVLPSFRQQQENNNNENNTLEILIENESIEDQTEKKITQNESISHGHTSKLSICIQDNIEKNLDFFSAAAAQQISHEDPKRNELPAEAIKNSLKARTGRILTNSAVKTQKIEAPPHPKGMTNSERKGNNIRDAEKINIAELVSKKSPIIARKNSKGQIIKGTSQNRNSADYQTPKNKIKPMTRDPQTTYEKTQEDTLDLDQSPLLTREDRSDLENFLDETTRGQLSQIINLKSLQELNHKPSPREKTERVILLDIQKGATEEVMSFGRAGSGEGSPEEAGAGVEEEEYDYSQQSYEQKSPVSVKSRENPNIMVNDIISKAILINDDGSETIEPLTEMKRSHSVEYRQSQDDDYHQILSSQDVPFENSDYAAGRRQHSRSKSLGISRIDLRNSRLENIPEETSQPATSNRETILLAESLRSRRSPNQIQAQVQGEEDSNDHPLNFKQIKTSYSISLANQPNTVQSTDHHLHSSGVSQYQQTEPVAFKPHPSECRDVAVDIQGASLKELERNNQQKNHHPQSYENKKESILQQGSSSLKELERNNQKHTHHHPLSQNYENKKESIIQQGPSSLKELEKNNQNNIHHHHPQPQVHEIQRPIQRESPTTFQVSSHHHHVESFNGKGTTIITPPKTTDLPKVPDFILNMRPSTPEANITTARKQRERSHEGQTSREINDLFSEYLESSNKKNPRSTSPPIRRVQYSPDTNKLVQSYFLTKESDPSFDQTQIQGKTFNTSASYIRFSNFTRLNNTTRSKTQNSGYFDVITSEGDYDSLKPIKERKYRECHVEGVRDEDSELDYSVNSDPTTTLFDKLMNRYMKAAQSPPKGSSMFEKNYEEYSQNANLRDLSLLSNLDHQHTNNLEISDIALPSHQFSPYKNQQGGSLDTLHQQSFDLSLLAIKDNNLTNNKFTSTTAGEETFASKNNPSHLLIQNQYEFPGNMSSIQRSYDKINLPKFGTPSSLAEPIQEASQINGRSSPMSMPKNMKSDPQLIPSFQNIVNKKTTPPPPQYQIQHETKSFNPQFLSNNPQNVSYPAYSYNSPSKNAHADLVTQQKIEEIKKEALTYKKSLSKGFTFLENIDVPAHKNETLMNPERFNNHVFRSEGKHRAASPDQLSPDYRSDDDVMEPLTLGAQKAFKGTPKKFDSKFLFSSPNRKSNY